MTLARLLQVKSRLHLQRVALVNPTIRCFCASSNGDTEKPSPSKRLSLSKRQKAAAVESFVKKYMETHPGIFPKATHVHNEVGGSWYTLKDILTSLKEKMLGNSQLQDHTTNCASDYTVDATALEIITTHNSEDISELGEAKSTVMHSKFRKDNISSTATSSVLRENSSKNAINATDFECVQTCSNTDYTELRESEGIVQSSKSSPSYENYEEDTTNATTRILEECSSADSVDLAAFKVINMHKYPVSIELAEPAHVARLPEAEVISQVNEKGISTRATSDILCEKPSEDMVLLDYTADSSKLVEPENGHMKPDRAVSEVISSVGDQKPKSEKSSWFRIMTEGSRTLQDQLASTGHRNHQPETKMRTSSLTPNAGCELVGKHLVSLGGVQKITGIADLFKRRMNDRAGGDMTHENNDSVTPYNPGCLNETAGTGTVENYDVMRLIDCIKELPKEQSMLRSDDKIMSNKTDQTSRKGPIRGMQSVTNSPMPDNKGRNTSLNDRNMGMENNFFWESEGDPGTEALFKVGGTNDMSDDSDRSGAVISSFQCIKKSKPSPEIPLLTGKQDLKKNSDVFSAEKVSDDNNKVFVRFLHVAAKWSDDIDVIFKDCGCITKIEFHYKGGLFKSACINFQTKEGMQEALKKTGLTVKNISIIVEAACSSDDIPSKTLIPNLIGYPEIPLSLVKNPTRTVMIKQLTPDISLCDIEEALAFCGSQISGFLFGSSTSVAFVEFETEEAKQRALERHSINVSGKRLLIFRIDAPRTTVLRISNLYYPAVKNDFASICKSYGKVKLVAVRSKDVVDVHFKLAEWPNMLKILNSLNGLKVCDCEWIAQPAPVFPPEVLHVLWKCPDGRRHLKSQIQGLLQKLEEPTAHKVGLASMTNEYYRMDYE